ncbi:MAG: Cu/Zn superoxide [Planctomycetota bacterium]|nr:MAG: Cu/Zn superoxide [Planctomycetota bacterium]
MKRFGLGLALAAAFAAGCGGGDEKTNGEGSGGASAKETKAVAKIESRDGSTVKGTATFTAKDGKVTLKVEIEGATAGMHAFHIHEKGDCSGADAKTAGGHWNPTAKAHGKWGEGEFHLGDIGNMNVGADGKGTLEVTTDLWSVGTGKDNDVVGKSVIVHEGVDDFKTQPTGNAGKRFGCAAIELVK